MAVYGANEIRTFFKKIFLSQNSMHMKSQFCVFKNSLPEPTEPIVCQKSSAKPTKTNPNRPVGASLEFVVEEEVVLVI